MENNTQNPEKVYECYINGLNLGICSYIAIARDYANNSNILYNENFIFKIIENTKKEEIFIFIYSSIIGLIGIISITIYKFVKKKISIDQK